MFPLRALSLAAVLLSSLASLMPAGTARALEVGIFETPLDDLEWTFREVEGLNCSLTKPVAGIGPVVLVAAAGARSSILLPAHLMPMPHGTVYVGLAPADWNRTDQLVSVPAHPRLTQQGLELELDMLSSVWLAQLDRPLQLVLHVRGELDSDLVALQIPTTGSALHKEKMTRCAKRLLPYDFEQLNNSVFYFASGKSELDDQQILKLQSMARYLEKDDTITSVIVDGHSDAAGERLRNLQLSQKRAQAISDCLVAAGLAKEQGLRIRHHGQRYPKASNRTREGRALNRRALVTLERDTRPIG